MVQSVGRELLDAIQKTFSLVVYCTTILLAQSVQFWMVEWLINAYKRMWSCPISKCAKTCMKCLRNTMKIHKQ
jgi:hypothetical protein